MGCSEAQLRIYRVTVQVRTHSSAQRQRRGVTGTEKCKFSLQEVKELTRPPLEQRNTRVWSTGDLLRGRGFAGKSQLANLQNIILKLKYLQGTAAPRAAWSRTRWILELSPHTPEPLLPRGLSAPTPSRVFSIQHIHLPYENSQLTAEGFSCTLRLWGCVGSPDGINPLLVFLIGPKFFEEVFPFEEEASLLFTLPRCVTAGEEGQRCLLWTLLARDKAGRCWRRRRWRGVALINRSIWI